MQTISFLKPHKLMRQFVRNSKLQKLIQVVSLQESLLYSLCKNLNPHSPCISNARDETPKCTKRYSRDFLDETSI